MNDKKRLFILLIIPLSILFTSWGWVGHQIISLNVSNSFTEEMAQFEDWAPFLMEHASDADYRKGSDPTEGPKHYIDIDAYPEFISTGRIPTTLDSCIDLHGASFVKSQGYLPWATLDTYNNIVEYMKQGEWENAKIAAADLGHYVADGFIPLHLTKNYDGQDSGNDGIHSRYESGMIGDYQGELIYDGSPVEEIEDITSYVFGYIYYNYQYLDDILAADSIAKAAAGGYGGIYTQTLWEQTGEFTIELFERASHAFANLIYNAWSEAGKPEVGGQGQGSSDLYISEEVAYLPESIGVTFADVGVLYVVPEDTDKDLALIRSASLDSLNALANFEVKIPLAGLSDGNYWVYARDFVGKISGPVEFSVTGSTSEVHLVLTENISIYPNPLGQNSHIDFTLSRNNHVSIKIMDLGGKLVELVQSGEMKAGPHHLTFHGNKLASAVYLVVIEVGEDVIVKKVMKK